MKTPVEQCDCLNWCGDDPRLESGTVRPCEMRLQARAKAQRLQEEINLLRECALQVRAWLTAGADPNAIPRDQISAAVAFVISRTGDTP